MNAHLLKYLQWGLISLVVVLMGLFSLHTLTSINQDIGRHIRVGEMVWQDHQIPTTNTFSFTAPDFPFVNHHWFGGVLLYLGYVAVGLKGLIVAKACMLAVAIALVLLAQYHEELSLATIWLAVLAIFILIERTDVRPEILSFLFMAWFLFVLFRKPTSWLLWTLPLVQLFWVNTHIYFFMGVAVFGAFIVGEVVRQGTWRLPNIRQLLVVLGALGFATLLNPSGWEGAVYPFKIFQNYGYSIVENKSPFFLQAYGYPSLTTQALFAGIAITALTLLINIQRIRHNIFSVLIFVSTATLSLMMVRNYSLFALIMVPVNLKNLHEIGFSWRNPLALGMSGVILLTLCSSVITNQIYTRAGLNRTFGLHVPAGAESAVRFVKENHLQGPIFNNFDIGSYLIWKLPEEKVFIDGRPEAYPADFIQKIYIPMQEDSKTWNLYAEQFNIQLVFFNYHDITPWAQTFVRHIYENSAWSTVYRDNGIMILVRNIPKNKDIIEKFKE